MRTPPLSPTGLILALLLTLLGSLRLVTDVPLAEAQGSVDVQVSPTSAAPGEAMKLRGDGWPSGAPLAAWMYSSSELGGPGASLARATTYATANGSFVIETAVPRTLLGQGNRGNLSVVPGDYTIVVSTGPNLTASAPLMVGAPHQGALLWGEVYLDTNSNGQRDQGDPPAMAEVAVSGSASGSPTLRAITDARGRYVLSPIAAGSYTLRAQAQVGGQTWTGATTTQAPDRAVARADLLVRGRVDVTLPEGCFVETGYCVDNGAFWDYFTSRGGVDTFGYPVSRTFLFQGFPTQFFQRLVLQEVPGLGVQRLNLLDPGLMPYTRINGATFPAHDPAVAAAAPSPDTPDYGQAALRYLRAVVPDEWEGQPVHFLQAYLRAAPIATANFQPLVALEVWGFPTSLPVRDPNNHEFIYQRFQRGILHYQGRDSLGNPITGGILLGDWFKALLTGRDLPADLEAQARADNSRYLRQYCPDRPDWVCRPAELPYTDLSFAFEPIQ